MAFGAPVSKNYGDCVQYHVELSKPHILSGKRTFCVKCDMRYSLFCVLESWFVRPWNIRLLSFLLKWGNMPKLVQIWFCYIHSCIFYTQTTLKGLIWMFECHFCLLLKWCEYLRFYPFLVTFWPLMTPKFTKVLNIGHRCVE